MRRVPVEHDRIFSDEERAEQYAKGHQTMAEMFGREYTKKLLARGFQRGRIIDVGCGFGAVNLILAKQFVDSEIVGIDLSEPLLRLARKAAQEAGVGERVRFEKADAQELFYEDNTFDVVISTNMVHLVQEPIRMLNELERILVRGGHLLVADLRRSWLGAVEREVRSGLTMREVRDLIGQSELREGKLSWGFLWWRFEA